MNLTILLDVDGVVASNVTASLEIVRDMTAIESLQRGRELGRRVGTKPIPERA